MTSNDIKNIMRKQGRADALALAARAPEMTGTEIIAEEDHIPAWSEKAVYTSAQVGYPVRDDGQVYTILMPHTPAHNPGSRPADLWAIYSLLHTTDPKKAKPFIASATSYYNKGDCCLNKAGKPVRSKIDANVFDPDVSPEFWEDPFGEVTA